MMFEDSGRKKEMAGFSQADDIEYKNSFYYKESNYKKYVFIFFVFATVIVSLFFFIYELRNKSYSPAWLKNTGNDFNHGVLPIVSGDKSGTSSVGIVSATTSSEKYFFGDYYKKQDYKYVSVNPYSYELPVNIKSDTVNYYDFSRKINLDQNIIDKLNKEGFAIAKNLPNNSKDNFWSTYQELINLDVPIMITSDFLLYYFQNNIKSIYKEIEKTVFYDNLWDINMTMYNTALMRYKALSSADNSESNLLLESARQEMTYFAVALKLLQPKGGQISDIKFLDENKFSPQDVVNYSFDLPEYLKNGVIEKEVSLILASGGKHKSPTFLYDKDYSVFRPPAAYKKNAKLNNFFLATEWMRMEFPLYNKSNNCADCLLDYDDWQINLGTASFIASDLQKNLELKNKWAIIYKFISFFSGLRQDLTFLNYDKAFVDLFGDGYDVAGILSKNNHNLVNDLEKIQKELINYDFAEIEGTYPRNSENKKYLGMRLLQDYFWPNGYIFDYLSGVDLKKTSKNTQGEITACQEKTGNVNRCSSFGMDIINLLKPIGVENAYFNKNALAYAGYKERSDDVFKQISNFNTNAWNSNVYWMTIDVMRNILNERNDIAYMNNNSWMAEKNFGTFLGGWVDVHLTVDEFIPHIGDKSKTDGALGLGGNCNKYNFIEPDIELVNEFISRSEMLFEMTNLLGVSKNTNVVSMKLIDLIKDFKKIRDIEKNQEEGRQMMVDDCRFIKAFVENYSVKEGDDNYFLIHQGHGTAMNVVIKEGSSGVRLLYVVNQDFDGKKIITVGPVYSYQESRAK